MTSIITGDIINSKSSEPKTWLNTLKTILSTYGPQPATWDVFRGDSFQLETPPEQALQAAILIKASLKQFKNIDVRMAIGIGEKTYQADKITESNGSAFINSGECFDDLKKVTLAIKSPFESFDNNLNLMFELALLTINNWTTTSAKLIKTALENPELTQVELAQHFETTQSNISKGLKRGGFDEISKLLNYYNVQVKQL
ncbi:SatD family protein [Algibacter miyuki]|uniref:SatD family protein n=1 Tax=Algibacter miyuki TaxID=1306933 RepID=A0ABV5GYT6_9FLAO|nr:SatD family protein [Algibacter miyuki]MDN3667034.1 SatD family protein [Algibacter miyuki]